MSNQDLLWFRFAEDTTLPAHISGEQQNMLEKIFDAHDAESHWSKALALLRLKYPPPAGKLIKWLDGVPYMHWNYMTEVVTGGSVKLTRLHDNRYEMKPCYNPFSLLRLIKTHWAISQYLNKTVEIDAPLPEGVDAQIIESLALGICLSAIRQRLPSMDEEDLAENLRSPDKLSHQQQSIIRQIHRIQERRTALSQSWHHYFPDTHENPPTKNTPPYFWNDAEHAPETTVSSGEKEHTSWKGIGVSGSSIVTGRVVFVPSLKNIPPISREDGPVVVVFPNARPETITAFADADAVLYGTGGVLAHACVIAREQNVTCVTAIGPDFIDDLRDYDEKGRSVWLNVDPQSGLINIIKEA